jgi:hypothetical protein
VEGIDRLYLNVYVPRFQTEGGIVGFFRHHRGQPLPSGADGSDQPAFRSRAEAFAAKQFRKRQRKDDVVAEQLRKFAKEEGVVLIGKAQEKTSVFRTERRRSPKTGQLDRALDRDGEPLLHLGRRPRARPVLHQVLHLLSVQCQLYVNGHEYAKWQLTRGIAFEGLDNGILSCADPEQLQQICDGLSAEKIDGFLRRWLRLLPHHFTGADRKAGYRYDISILQAEFSLTQVLDRPAHGRLFFEQVIRENLDLGRPEEVSLSSSGKITRSTPGKFRTRIVTEE